MTDSQQGSRITSSNMVSNFNPRHSVADTDYDRVGIQQSRLSAPGDVRKLQSEMQSSIRVVRDPVKG